MNNAATTLQDVFKAGHIQIDEQIRDRLSNHRELSLLKQSIVQDLSNEHWQNTITALLETMADCLDLDISEIFINAWSKYDDLTHYMESLAQDANSTVLIPLAEHTIQSRHHPSIELLLNSKSIGKIDLTVEISAKLRGFTLKLQDGKIKAILTGSCQIGGAIYLEDLQIAEVESREMALPGNFDLGEGIPLFRASD